MSFVCGIFYSCIRLFVHFWYVLVSFVVISDPHTRVNHMSDSINLGTIYCVSCGKLFSRLWEHHIQRFVKKTIIWVSIVHSDTWLLMVFDLNVDYWRKLVTMAISEGICSHTLHVMSFSFMNTVSSVYCIQYSVLTPDFTLLTLESWLSIILTLNSQLSILGSWLGCSIPNT